MKPFERTLEPRFRSRVALALFLSASFARAQAPVPPAEPGEVEAPTTPETPAPADAGAAAVSAEAPTAPPAAPTPAPFVEASAPLPSDAASDAEAAAIEAELKSGGASDSGSEFKLNLYGFADFTYTLPLKGALDVYRPSFIMGKLNLYAAADLGDDWRSLSEVRFMYLPHGSTPASAGPTAASAARIDTSVRDYSDIGRPVRWGGISIERAWLEHTFHPLLTVRVGQWLTPYGIWNVDHGSPVIIGVTRPYIVGDALFPQYQTGIETYGSMGFGPSQVGYHLTLSNGRGPLDSYKDLDHNKAVGIRVFYRNDSDFGVVTVGASGYRGRYTDAIDEFGVEDGIFVIKHPVVARYDELSLAADVKWEWGGFLIQGEAIMNDVAFDDRYRPAFVSFTGGPPRQSPDHRKLGFYALTGYRLPFFGLMPWINVESYDPGLHQFLDSVASLWCGLNARPTPRVVLKTQFVHVWSTHDELRLDQLDFQAAWSF